jgi:hypothetical protein
MLSYTPMGMGGVGFMPTIHLFIEWVTELAAHSGNSQVISIAQGIFWIILFLFSIRPLWAMLGFLIRAGLRLFGAGWRLHKSVTEMTTRAKRNLRKAILTQIRVLLKRVEEKLSTL